MEVILPDGASFTTFFRSKWFLDKYIFKGNLPVGIRADAFEDYEVEERFSYRLDKIMKYINSKGKFLVVGWAKRGEVMDQNVDQPSNGLPHNTPKTMVQSGTLNHHITKLEPMTPTVLSQEFLDILRFDVIVGFNVS